MHKIKKFNIITKVYVIAYIFNKAHNLRVECYLDEIIVEVQIFLGLYLTIIIYNSF
jgi:hypothetical protein